MFGFIFSIAAATAVTDVTNTRSILNILSLMGVRYGIQFMLEYYGLTKNIYVLRSIILIGSISSVYFALRSFYPLKNTYILKSLIFLGFDVVNWRGSFGNTALMFASSQGNTNMVSILLGAGADINAVSNNGITALMFASAKGYNNVVSLLLKEGAAINVVNDNGKTALMFASNYGYGTVVPLLLEAGADINAVSNDGKTALMFASDKGYGTVIPLLLEAGADINAVSNDGKSALMFASDRGHSNIVSLLLKAGADINAVSYDGRTALISASCRGDSNMVSFLLKAGADINASNNGWKALMFASDRGHSNIVSLLLKAGADINAVNNNGWTALMSDSDRGRSNVVYLLLKWGADINIINTDEQNAFALAKNDDCRNLIKAAQVAIKQILNEALSFDEASFLSNKNNAALVEQYIKDRSLFILQKIFSGKELIEQDRIFTKYSSDLKSLKDNFREFYTAASDSVSAKLSPDVMSKIFQFIPIEETFKIGPNIIEYSNLKSKIDVIRNNAINNQNNDIASVESIESQKPFSVGFWGGAFLGTLLINPAIRCGRDKINDVNNDKTLGESYQEALSLDNLNGIIAAFVAPTITQIAYFYLGIPYIAQSYQFTEIVKQITDSPFAQGFLQASLIEGTMLAMDVVGALGKMAYCTAYECE